MMNPQHNGQGTRNRITANAIIAVIAVNVCPIRICTFMTHKLVRYLTV